MRNRDPAGQTCLQGNAAWRRQAAHLHEHATVLHLSDDQRDRLLREAAAAEQQAGMWLIGAIEAS